jgi:hypothetical protein
MGMEDRSGPSLGATERRWLTKDRLVLVLVAVVSLSISHMLTGFFIYGGRRELAQQISASQLVREGAKRWESAVEPSEKQLEKDALKMLHAFRGAEKAKVLPITTVAVRGTLGAFFLHKFSILHHTRIQTYINGRVYSLLCYWHAK